MLDVILEGNTVILYDSRFDLIVLKEEFTSPRTAQLYYQWKTLQMDAVFVTTDFAMAYMEDENEAPMAFGDILDKFGL